MNLPIAQHSISIANLNCNLKSQIAIEIQFKNHVMYISCTCKFQLQTQIAIWNLKLQFQFANEIEFENDVIHMAG